MRCTGRWGRSVRFISCIFRPNPTSRSRVMIEKPPKVRISGPGTGSEAQGSLDTNFIQGRSKTTGPKRCLRPCKSVRRVCLVIFHRRNTQKLDRKIFEQWWKSILQVSRSCENPPGPRKTTRNLENVNF